MRNVSDLSREELENIVGNVQAILWLDVDRASDNWDPDKSWDSETIEYVADALIRHGLRPAEGDQSDG